MSGNRRSAATLLRVLAIVAGAAVVLGVAYVIVNPRSGPTVSARQTAPPVTAFVSQPIELGRGRASLAAGGAGLWVARQSPSGAPGRLMRIDTTTMKPDKTYPLQIAPLGLAVGAHTVWVLGTMPGSTRADALATLVRFDPRRGRVVRSVHLAEETSCSTAPFASCYPVATSDGVWVPLIDAVVHVAAAGTMPDRDVPVGGDVWDMAAGGRHLWVLAETAAYRIDEHARSVNAKRPVRVPLRTHLGPGMQSNHVAAEGDNVWISSYPRSHVAPASRITQLRPTGPAPKVLVSRMFPGAGPLALLDGGLWLARFDGQGELDRLDAATGKLTGPFRTLPDDPTGLVAYDHDLWVLSYRSSDNVRTVTRVSLRPVG